jgi:hypothetical protein
MSDEHPLAEQPTPEAADPNVHRYVVKKTIRLRIGPRQIALALGLTLLAVMLVLTMLLRLLRL